MWFSTIEPMSELFCSSLLLHHCFGCPWCTSELPSSYVQVQVTCSVISWELFLVAPPFTLKSLYQLRSFVALPHVAVSTLSRLNPWVVPEYKACHSQVPQELQSQCPKAPETTESSTISNYLNARNLLKQLQHDKAYCLRLNLGNLAVSSGVCRKRKSTKKRSVPTHKNEAEK